MNVSDELLIIVYLFALQFKRIFLFWILGVVLGSLLSVFASSRIRHAVSQMNPLAFQMKATVLAALLGAVSPICMYGTVPLIAAVGRKGIPQYLLAAFMVSSILINPSLFVYSFALGVPLALARLMACLAAGILAGILVYCFFKRQPLFQWKGFGEPECRNQGAPGFKRLAQDLKRGIFKTAPYFLAGIFLTALFDRYFPKDWIIQLFGNNKGLGVLLAASLGIPVYVCGGGTIPLLKAWLEAGMSPGSALAFMITGPATKLTNLSAVKMILGMKNFILYIIFMLGWALIAGIGVDLVCRLWR
jgi:uncharacterized membrane protein YraQ (UPF0718 family)